MSFAVLKLVKWRRAVLPAIALMLLFTSTFFWWRWSNSIYLDLHADFPCSYYVDVVSGERLRVPADGEIRLQVDRDELVAIIDLESPQGTCRAKLSCHEGYFDYLPPFPYEAETVSGPATWLWSPPLGLCVEAARPGTCAVISEHTSWWTRGTMIPDEIPGSGTRWVPSDRGQLNVWGCNLTLEGEPGWTIHSKSGGHGSSRVLAAADRVESLVVIDADGVAQRSVRNGERLEVPAPTKGSWRIIARSARGEELSIALDCGSLKVNRTWELCLTPP